jgi:site-specific DNA-methyltransferase (adenine-specific)
MFRDWVDRFTSPGDTILDPYAGSGTSAVAAKELGRKSVVVEGWEPYCEIIAKRCAQDVFDFGGVA